MSFITSAAADKNTYDVIVVGSGAAGGQTAYTLAMEGARVLMLEAGRHYEPATETPMMQTNADAPLRGAGTPEKPFGFWDATIDGGWEVPGEPYTSASDDPGAAVRLVARPDARRPHQPLGPHFPAQRAVRLQAAYPRRARLRLADGLRRNSRRTTTRSRC